jgi:glycosyltransferase involved in cell wall biosynthesis
VELQRRFDVTLVAFSRRNHQVDGPARERAAQVLRQLLSRVADPVAIASEWSRVQQVENHLLSLARQRPYTYYEYGAKAFRDGLAKAVQEAPPQVVHVDSLDLYRWLPHLPPVPIACTHHSIESELLRLRAERIGSPPLERYLAHQARLLERVERAVCPSLALNVMMSALDAKRLQELAPGSRVAVVPNGVDLAYFTPIPDIQVVPGRIVFLGPTYMFPNRDGIEFFLGAIWPAIRAAMPNASLHLIGRCPPYDRSRLEQYPGVVCQGYVDDVRTHLAAAACTIVPLRVGGGTRLKILDAWAMAKPVVSTSLGCEGLDLERGDNIIVEDRPEDFARAVLQVLQQPELRKQLGTRGRQTVEAQYSWAVVGDRICRAYEELAEPALPSPL